MPAAPRSIGNLPAGGGANRRLVVCIGAGLCLWLVVRAAMQGGDADWDLRNYHLYGPFALLHGRMSLDLLPAQLQSFYPPTLDLPYYVLTRLVHRVWLLNALLALPHCGAVVLAFAVTLRMLRVQDLAGVALAALATLIGATGAAMLPTLATTMSEAVPVACILAALLTLATDSAWTGGRLLLAGLLCGAAAGLKLTEANAGVALGVAVLLCGGGGLRRRAGQGVVYGAGCLLGAAAVGGWWWWRVYALTGDPVFPHYNSLFHSALIPPFDVVDTRFLPKTALQWLAYPLFWAVRPFSGVSEVPVRDPRIALAALGVAITSVWAWRRPQRAPQLLVVFLAVTYVLWERQFSILRYLACVELLSGTVMATALMPLLRSRAARGQAAGGLAALLVALQVVTIYPDWGHSPSASPVSVTLPPMAENSLVLLLDPSPMAYVAVFAPASARFVGVNNNLIHLNHAEPLEQRAQRLIEAQTGQIWGMEIPGPWSGANDASLAFYGLHREGCMQVGSSLDGGQIRLCRLQRDAASPQ